MIEVRRPRDEPELAQALELRRTVFVVEQGVSEAEEYDGRDDQAIHLVALEGARVIGTCRLLTDEGPRARLGRVAVSGDRRRRGVASALLTAAESAAAEAGARHIVLHAQTYALGLYETAGYRVRGAPFQEAGVEHVTMERDLA